jgi:hypothetical protein
MLIKSVKISLVFRRRILKKLSISRLITKQHRGALGHCLTNNVWAGSSRYISKDSLTMMEDTALSS